jgi:signal transduction histidine kinase
MAIQSRLAFSSVRRRVTALDAYLALVTVAGAVLLVWLLPDVAVDIRNAGLAFWVLAACVLPAELIRIPVWRGKAVYLFTMSRPFVLALVTGWGIPLAVVVFMVASVVSDLLYRKPAARVSFNAGMYALSIAATGWVYHRLGGHPPLGLRQVPAFVAATIVLVMVSRALVRIAITLHERRPLTLGYVLAGETQVELVEAAVQFSWVLVALLVADHRPLLAAMLAAPAVPIFALGQAAGQLQALKARRRGLSGEDELADLERQREGVLQMLELERVRFAADLHDGPVQRLRQHVERLRMVQASIEAGSPDVARQVRQLEQEAMAESRNLRDLVAALRPPVLQDLDLAGALTRLTAEFQSSYGDIVFDVQTHAVDGLSEKLEVVLYRVAQEALANVVKHAHASHVQVAMAVGDGVARLQVRDDGTGFDPSSVPTNGHYGLALMRKQVELVDGSFQVDGRDGTTITVEIQLGALPEPDQPRARKA